MRKKSVFGKIFFIIILISVVENFFDVGGNFTANTFMSPFVWMFVFFAGVSGFSYFMRYLDNTRNTENINREEQWIKEEPKEEKSEYDFDDEFKIDPKDYE